MSKDKIYQQGKDAYLNMGKCPYAPNTKEFRWWIAGFNAQHQQESNDYED